ncbi:hypothetical protein CCACVL1_07867 [Corchorus capsularis]|uniref:Uncharacterized protein n=1 Tax=Corchorus capsularis TaxID=210143 RepID=A0A1R3J3L1_COCAP|nr:hypothetical protein CCACVL1_07867 [Corchorus capsularis]
METGIRVSAGSLPYIPLPEYKDDDDGRLKQLGYKQELSRSLS